MHHLGTHTRRDVLRVGAGLLGGIAAARVLGLAGGDAIAAPTGSRPGYGPLVPRGPISLPAEFRFVELGAVGATMSDGLPTPGDHDGMAVFPGTGDGVILIRNHEGYDKGKAIGPARAYDPVAQGGVTRSLFDTKTEQLVESSLVLNGTDNNCSGGPTPWGTWLTCEESTVGPGEGFERPHGYVFEIPFGATEPVEPRPLKALGRFVHEATAVDPRTGIVYLTEDNGEPADGVYRFIPEVQGQLERGGTLQMLKIAGEKQYDTTKGQEVGRRLPVEWVTISDPDPSDAERHPEAVFMDGFDNGGAGFLGLEAASWSNGSLYLTASEGGDEGLGQIWRYAPKGRKKGVLTLLYESSSRARLDQPDNVVISPRGGAVLCEDGDGEDRNGGSNFVRMLKPNGKVAPFIRNDTPLDLHSYDDEVPEGAIGRSEFAGPCYSPDGRWLFVNIQYPGVTLAVTGPWEKGWL